MQAHALNEDHHIKKGWLMKCAKDSGKNWRKRYFILTNNTMNYYLSDKDLRKPKGNVLIVGDAKVRNENAIATKGGAKSDKKFFGFRLTTPFESILFLSVSEKDRAVWVRAIQDAIGRAHQSLRGYMLRRTNAVSIMDPTVRKFWVLHKDTLTIHKDHENTKVDEFAYTITDHTEIEPDDDKLKIKINAPDGKRIVTIQFEERTAGEYPLWRDALLDIRCRHEREEEAYEQRVAQVFEEAVASSSMAVLAEDGSWHSSQVAFNANEVVVQDTNADGSTHATFYKLSPSSTIKVMEPEPAVEGEKESDTEHIKFQITTASETIVLTANSQEEVEQWTEAIAKVAPPQVLHTDSAGVLRRAALTSWPEGIYETTVTEKKALGIVFQPFDEWAVVKQYAGYDASVTGVSPGSVLMAINGESVILKEFGETTTLLSACFHAPEPLVLTFRQAPTKIGNLNKKSANQKNGTSKWTNRQFELSAGKLIIYPIEGEGDTSINIPLKNATVKHIPFSDYLRENCFRVNVGNVSMILQAESVEDMIDWASQLELAIAILSGGSFLLEDEQKKAYQQEEMSTMLLAMPEEMSEEAQACIISIGQAITDKNAAALEPALQAAYAMEDMTTNAMDFLEYSGATLNELYETEHFNETDFQAICALVQPDEEQARIMEEQAFINDAMNMMDGEDGDSDDESEISTVSRKTMGGTSLGQCGPNVSGLTAEEIEDIENEASALEYANLMELQKLEEPNPAEVGVCANEEDLDKIFGFYKRTNPEGGADFINVMNFCTIWRMVTGEKGNLMREMQVFNSFDNDKNGYLEADDFISGFLNHSVENNTNALLIQLHHLVDGGSVML